MLRPGLPRRIFFGVRLADGGRGTQVHQVHPESTAAKLGVGVGDRFVSICGERVVDAAQCQRRVRTLSSGDVLELVVARVDGEVRLRGRAAPWPTERFDEGTTLILDHVDISGCGERRQRIFLTRPNTPGPHPAVMMMRGFSCRSSEYPLRPREPLRLLLGAWARAGYCTLRVEKSGVGDSDGPPCPEDDFAALLAGSRAGLEVLRSADFVDSDRIALFGHSVGGMIAPLLATQTPVAGIGTLGTSADRFDVCASASRRRQLALGGEPLADLDDMEALQTLLVREQLDLHAALQRRPDLLRVVPRLLPAGKLFGRSLAFSRQLDQAPIEAAWRSLNAEVAVFHAEYDYVCDREEAARIVEVVNTEGCGRARLVELWRTGHLLYTHESLDAAFEEPEVGSTQTGIAEATLAWLRRAFA